MTREDEMGIGAEAVDARDVKERLDATERDALRELIWTAVRDGEILDAKAWKKVKADRRSADASAV